MAEDNEISGQIAGMTVVGGAIVGAAVKPPKITGRSPEQRLQAARVAQTKEEAARIRLETKLARRDRKRLRREARQAKTNSVTQPPSSAATSAKVVPALQTLSAPQSVPSSTAAPGTSIDPTQKEIEDLLPRLKKMQANPAPSATPASTLSVGQKFVTSLKGLSGRAIGTVAAIPFAFRVKDDINRGEYGKAFKDAGLGATAYVAPKALEKATPLVTKVMPIAGRGLGLAMRGMPVIGEGYGAVSGVWDVADDYKQGRYSRAALDVTKTGLYSTATISTGALALDWWAPGVDAVTGVVAVGSFVGATGIDAGEMTYDWFAPTAAQAEPAKSAPALPNTAAKVEPRPQSNAAVPATPLAGAPTQTPKQSPAAIVKDGFQTSAVTPPNDIIQIGMLNLPNPPMLKSAAPAMATADVPLPRKRPAHAAHRHGQDASSLKREHTKTVPHQSANVPPQATKPAPGTQPNEKAAFAGDTAEVKGESKRLGFNDSDVNARRSLSRFLNLGAPN